MSFREVLKKFVVFDDRPEPGPPSVPGAPGAPPVPPAGADSPSPAASQLGDFDLTDLYQQEGIPSAALAAEKALEILRSLPEGLSPEIQSQAFKDLLRKKGAPLGVSPETVVEDARRKINVLSASAKGMPEKLSEFISVAEAEIANLEEQVQERKKAIGEAQEQQRQLTQKCRSEIDRLTTVLQLLQPPEGSA
jgi:hypothetical protein